MGGIARLGASEMNTSGIVRGELLALIRQELLGPRHGDDEEIPGSPRAAYAIGALAPVTVDPSLARLDATAAGENDAPQSDPTKTAAGVNDVDPREVEQQGVPVPTDE